MREQLPQRRGTVRLRQRRHISSDASIEVHDTFVRQYGSERGGDRFGATPYPESMAGGCGDAMLQIDLAIGLGKRENASRYTATEQSRQFAENGFSGPSNRGVLRSGGL